jgi:hypothetical protein
MAVSILPGTVGAKKPASGGWRLEKMKFQIGDAVRAGMHVGTVTDVGTVLVQVTTNEGTSRVVCPWELVRVRGSNDQRHSNIAPRDT